MSAIQVAVVNLCGLSDPEVVDGMGALQQQLDQDFAPVWGMDATLVQWRPHVQSPDHWGLVLLNGAATPSDGDEYAALWIYGHFTSHRHPLARVFVDQRHPGEDWTHLASHELLEMLVDPGRNAAVYREGGNPYHVYARRVCDPCAAYLDGYERSGHIVSDFVCPAWFGGFMPLDPMDEQGKIQQEFELRTGGSVGVVDPANGKWAVLDSSDHLATPPVEKWAPGQLGIVPELPELPKPLAASASGQKLGWGP